MKILVVGGNGQLGWELSKRGRDKGLDILSLDLPEIDIADPFSVKKNVSQSGASIVINAAAYTAVDKAESEEALAYAVNKYGPAYLASECKEAGIPLIHVSTDYVFDGSKKGPYLETDPVSPLGVYGRSKAAGEEEIGNRLKEHIILRTAWLYGVHGSNFVKTMLRLCKETQTLKVVADQNGCPTYSADLAEAILTIADHIIKGMEVAWGTYHFCGGGATTWHGFAEAIFKIAGRYESFHVKEVIPINTSEYPTPARRPHNSVLDCSLLRKNFGINPPPWEESLAVMLRELLGKNADEPEYNEKTG